VNGAPGAEYRTTRRAGAWPLGSGPALATRQMEHERYIVSENSSRPINMRRISLVPAPIS
jgi:hypothetical protein